MSWAKTTLPVEKQSYLPQANFIDLLPWIGDKRGRKIATASSTFFESTYLTTCNASCLFLTLTGEKRSRKATLSGGAKSVERVRGS
jgi:hypothetical protein